MPSNRDFFWGSSLTKEATENTHPEGWPGRNALGGLLERVRDKLRESLPPESTPEQGDDDEWDTEPEIEPDNITPEPTEPPVPRKSGEPNASATQTLPKEQRQARSKTRGSTSHKHNQSTSRSDSRKRGLTSPNTIQSVSKAVKIAPPKLKVNGKDSNG